MSDFSIFMEKAKHANVIPVVTTMPADLLTPLSVYLKLSAKSKNSFLLESVEGGKSLARYSFIGVDPESVTDLGGEKIFESLKDHFGRLQAESDPDLPSFIGGAIGYLGFDCSNGLNRRLGVKIPPQMTRPLCFFARPSHLTMQNRSSRSYP
jgi:anthranilate synthase component 1